MQWTFAGCVWIFQLAAAHAMHAGQGKNILLRLMPNVH